MKTDSPIRLVHNRIETMSRSELVALTHALVDIACSADELAHYAFPTDCYWRNRSFYGVMELVEQLADVIDDASELLDP